MQLWTPVLPASLVDMLCRINAEGVETCVVDPIIIDRHETISDIGGLGLEIVQAPQLAGNELSRVVEILDVAEIVKQGRDCSDLSRSDRRVVVILLRRPELHVIPVGIVIWIPGVRAVDDVPAVV